MDYQRRTFHNDDDDDDFSNDCIGSDNGDNRNSDSRIRSNTRTM